MHLRPAYFREVIINGVFTHDGVLYVRTLVENGCNARIVGTSLTPTHWFDDDTEVYI